MIRPGSYVLFMTFDRDVELRIGALGDIVLESGTYCYVGSARNGLDQRIARHLRKEKKIRWHIDNLTIAADSIEAYESIDLEECRLRNMAESSGLRPSVKGFGCSDCRCSTHLLTSDEGSKDSFISYAGLKFHGWS